MSGGAALLNDVCAAFEPHGIFVRGVVAIGPEEKGPLLASGRPAGAVILLGNIGGSIWAAFDRWRGEHGAVPDPLDSWSKFVIQPVAARIDATAYFPSDRPWQPFQQWAMRAEGLKASPLGILIHPDFGLWHGYRGALGVAEGLDLEAVKKPHPCDDCRTKPCLYHCPVTAVAPDRFDVGRCRSYLRSPDGEAGCMRRGCDARNACPVGADYRYPEAQLRFHMAALGGV